LGVIEVEAVDQRHSAESSFAASPFCPECGQLMRAHQFDPTWSRAQRSSFWPCVLLIVGVCLAVTFGSRALTSYRSVVDTRALQQGLTASTSASATGTSNPDVRLAQAADAARLREISGGATRQLDREALACALGLATIVVGLGALARPKVLRRAEQRLAPKGADLFSGRDAGIPPALKAWTFAESVYMSAVRVFLVVCICLTASRLIQGDPPSWILVDQALNRALDVVIAISSMLH
jgi:hypothetical protein